MRRLEGKVIAVTRPLERAQVAVDIITGEGGVALLAPTLELVMTHTESLMELCQRGKELDWIIFTSPASLQSLFQYCPDFKYDLNPNCRIAVIGPRTQRALEEYGLKAEFVPEDYTAEGLLKVMAPLNLEGKFIGIPRTFSARDVLPAGLRKMGAQVLLAEAYKSTLPQDLKPVQDLIENIFNDEVDAVTFTSPLTVHNLFEIAAEKKKELLNTLKSKEIILVAIGPITGQAIQEYDLSYIAPSKYTVEAMLNKMMDDMNKR
jgi:uroporphyrinogen-III synthase